VFCRLSDTVGPFGHKRCFTPLRQSEVIFVERMGPNNTHLERFARGVVEHPESDPRAEGGPGRPARMWLPRCISRADSWYMGWS